MNPLEVVNSSALLPIFEAQQQAFAQNRNPAWETRIKHLKQLKLMLQSNIPAFEKALSDDFGHRSSDETRVAEIAGTVANIEYTIKHLAKWMAPEGRSTSIWFKPADNKLIPQPLGVAAVMVPWNYPVNLSIVPLASALAAGNRCMIKMSELTPSTEKLLRKLLAEYFAEDHVSIIGGDSSVAAEFSSLPFDHILFTGSTNVGKKVMAAAARNLTPVTLELGGKSPVIVSKDYPLEEASQRILWGKTTNAGQTCVAPDYALIPRGKTDDLKVWMSRHFRTMFPKGADSPDYTSIIDEVNFIRLNRLIDDAEKKGAEVVRMENPTDFHQKRKKLPFTLVINPPEDSLIMKEEIFGPILIVLEVDSVDEAIDYVNDRERPLALYYFGHSESERENVLKNTIAGCVAINDVLMQYLQVSLPFGGVGSSGFGSYHGREGFDTFSHKKSVFTQRGVGRFTGTKLIYPPYTSLGRSIIKMMGGG